MGDWKQSPFYKNTFCEMGVYLKMKRKIENIVYYTLRIVLLFIGVVIATYICKRNLWYIIGFLLVILCIFFDYIDGNIMHTPMKGGKNAWIELEIGIYVITVYLYLHNIISNLV